MKELFSLTDADFDERMEKSKNMHVVITCIPMMGHFTPLIRLAEALEKRDHRVSFLTFSFNKSRCET